MKICTKCKIEQNEDNFYKDERHLDKLMSSCKECCRRYGRIQYQNNSERYKIITDRYRKANPERCQIAQRKRLYNMSVEEYNNLLRLQDNVCAICGEPETVIRKGRVYVLSVDHNHITNRNRGLLCSRCNRLLGNAVDNQQILLNAIRYLELYATTDRT
jgi:hypothetical protein